MKKYVLLVFLLAACSRVPRIVETYDMRMDSYKGYTEDQLIQEMGRAPDRYYEANGMKYITFAESETYQSGGECTMVEGTGGCEPIKTRIYSCETTFRMKGGKVISTVWKGNSCDNRTYRATDRNMPEYIRKKFEKMAAERKAIEEKKAAEKRAAEEKRIAEEKAKAQ